MRRNDIYSSLVRLLVGVGFIWGGLIKFYKPRPVGHELTAGFSKGGPRPH